MIVTLRSCDENMKKKFKVDEDWVEKYDWIILATGYSSSIESNQLIHGIPPLFKELNFPVPSHSLDLHCSHPIPVAGIYPCLSDSLQWRRENEDCERVDGREDSKDGWRLFVCGPLARLVLGPNAHNLEGGEKAAGLIEQCLREMMENEKEKARKAMIEGKKNGEKRKIEKKKVQLEI